MRNRLDASSPQPQSRSGEEGPAGDGGAALRREMGHSHGAAASWAAAAADGFNDFFSSTGSLSPPSLRRESTGHLNIHIKKRKRPMCTGQTATKWHLLQHPGAAPFTGTCPQPRCSGTLWGHLPPMPDLNTAHGPAIISQLCFGTAF